MKKTLGLFLSLIFLGIQLCFAQRTSVSGTVTDASDGSPLPGVTVAVKGEATGASTDHNGKFTLRVPAGATLVFSYIGMKTQEIAVGNQKTFQVKMESESTNIDEVVVTAMGINRQEKSLGYSVSTVKSDELTAARENSVINSLAGKMAGVNVSASSGTPGGSARIIIRGQSSLGTSGQPIFVIDGVPVSNSSYNPAGIQGNVDAGSRIGDISSDDIESMSVLKGAAATALYGARAKDGAVIITTKRGAKNMKTTVSVNSSFRMDRVLKLPEFQNDYAPGNPQTGEYSVSYLNGWGPRIADVQDQEFTIFTGEKVKLQAYPDNVKDFYNTGYTFINSVSASGGDEKNDFRLGFSAHNQTGIVPSNDYDKYNITFNGGHQFTEKLSARVSVSYANVKSEGRPAQGSNDVNVLIPTINSIPRTLDMKTIRENWITEDEKAYAIDGTSSGKTNNPFWIINKNKYTDNVDRFIGSAMVEFEPVKNLKISNNAGIDYYKEDRRQVWAYNTIGKQKGAFDTYDITSRVINNDLILTYDWQINEDFGLKVIAGQNIYESEIKRLIVNASDLLVPDVYAYANAEAKIPTNIYRKNRLVGLYGDIGFSFRNMVFLNVTGRNDWSSTMPKSHRSYFYPSVSAGFVFTELIPANDILSYGKFRINYANVGSDTDPYALDYVYTPENSYFLQFIGSDGGKFPHGGLLGYAIPGRYPDPNLKPQNQSAFEIGADLRLFNGRITIDATYYRNMTTNNIADIDAPNSTGYFYFKKNAGKILNKGVELMVGLTPVHNQVKWDINLNFAANRQTVKELDPSVDMLNLTSGWSGLQVKAAVGEPFSLYGVGWERDPDGNILINASNGSRLTSSTAVNLGKIAPDWTLGIGNTLSFKGLSLGFLIDIRQGGVMYSGTVSNLRTSGQAKETLLNDRMPIIDQGVVQQADGTYIPNTTLIKPYDYWQNYKVGNTEANIFDASYVKLRELTLNYNLPGKWFDKCFIKKVSVGIEGRNLWIIKSHVPHIDPEMSFFSPGEVGSSVEFASIPTTRSFGFNLKFDF